MRLPRGPALPPTADCERPADDAEVRLATLVATVLLNASNAVSLRLPPAATESAQQQGQQRESTGLATAIGMATAAAATAAAT